ncbi:TPA: hypothetical protein ACTZ6X_002933 [Legionella pneumophila]
MSTKPLSSILAKSKIESAKKYFLLERHQKDVAENLGVSIPI